MDQITFDHLEIFRVASASGVDEDTTARVLHAALEHLPDATVEKVLGEMVAAVDGIRDDVHRALTSDMRNAVAMLSTGGDAENAVRLVMLALAWLRNCQMSCNLVDVRDQVSWAARRFEHISLMFAS